uniref:Neuropeptide CCH2 n=1 Tax=Diaphorina citri TaxID=121845 RepID=A0A2U9PFQ7_DIACI|nr:neuropeptide CCH2 [Diaphorina citri]
MSVQYSAGCFLLVIMMALVISTVDVASAKRGCASFGHSCFGGHGKRSSPDDPDTLAASDDYFAAPPLSPKLKDDYFYSAPGAGVPLAGVPLSGGFKTRDYALAGSDAMSPPDTGRADRGVYHTAGGTRFPARPEEWFRQQQVLSAAADLSPVIRQMIRSYRQHQMKNLK